MTLFWCFWHQNDVVLEDIKTSNPSSIWTLVKKLPLPQRAATPTLAPTDGLLGRYTTCPPQRPPQRKTRCNHPPLSSFLALFLLQPSPSPSLLPSQIPPLQSPLLAVKVPPRQSKCPPDGQSAPHPSPLFFPRRSPCCKAPFRRSRFIIH